MLGGEFLDGGCRHPHRLDGIDLEGAAYQDLGTLDARGLIARDV